MKNSLIICLGPICSGKTTWSLNYIQDNKNVYRFSFDEFTKMLKGDGVYDPIIKEIATVTIFKLLINCNLVLDGFPLDSEALEFIIDCAKSSTLRLFDIKLDEALKRNFNRRDKEGKFIPIKEMVTYYKSYQEFINSEGFLNIKKKTDVFINDFSHAKLYTKV